MEEVFMSTDEIIHGRADSPLPISVIPDRMGINLCSVEGISYRKQEDGQLISLTIHFKPDNG